MYRVSGGKVKGLNKHRRGGMRMYFIAGGLLGWFLGGKFWGWW